MSDWLASHHKAYLDLVVAHSHSHRDHVYGDSQFLGRPHTTVIQPELSAIREFFKLVDWPEGSGSFDLGGRLLTIIPAPGHEKTHLAIYDSNTRILLTGDMLYPGLLTVDDWPAYRNSVGKLSVFVSSHPVSYILGAHIEMMSTPQKIYPLGSRFQPDEHQLQLGVRHLVELQQACERLGDNPVRDVHDDFIIYPRPH
jgi:hypothetical protein